MSEPANCKKGANKGGGFVLLPASKVLTNKFIPFSLCLFSIVLCFVMVGF